MMTLAENVSNERNRVRTYFVNGIVDLAEYSQLLKMAGCKIKGYQKSVSDEEKFFESFGCKSEKDKINISLELLNQKIRNAYNKLDDEEKSIKVMKYNEVINCLSDIYNKVNDITSTYSAEDYESIKYEISEIVFEYSPKYSTEFYSIYSKYYDKLISSLELKLEDKFQNSNVKIDYRSGR